MTSDIANILKSYISPVGFSDKVAGLVKAVTVVDVNDDGTKTRRTFPISCDISYTECERGKYLDLVPNKKYRSIMYFEDGGSRITGDTPRDFVFTSSLRLVCWMNLSKLGKTDCSVSGLAVANILNLLPDNFNNSGMYSRMRITAVSQEIKSPAIFSKYTYKEETLQYLMYPYDYFAINIEVQYNVNKNCIEDWTSGTELDCLEINVPSLCQSVIDRYNALSAEDKACVQAYVCEATPCSDATVTNSDATYSQTVASGGELELPDISFTDSDGTVSSVAAQTNIVATPQVKALFLKALFDTGDDEMESITIDADNAGTYTSISDDGGSGAITLNINSGGFGTFSNPTVLGVGDTLIIKRATTTGDGWVKLTGTYT